MCGSGPTHSTFLVTATNDLRHTGAQYERCCARIVLTPTSFQPTQAYSSQGSYFLKTLAPVGLSEFL
jgi:hypothetical protein